MKEGIYNILGGSKKKQNLTRMYNNNNNNAESNVEINLSTSIRFTRKK